MSKAEILMMIEQANEDKRCHFESLSDNNSKYSEAQKHYAFELIDESGINATARILQVPRRTLQRWCRKYGVFVKRCPDWVYEWAERRRKHRRY